jgi:hypothetical protein
MRVSKYVKRRIGTKLLSKSALFIIDERTAEQLEKLSMSFGISKSKAVRYAVKYAYYSMEHYRRYTVEHGKPLSRYLQKKYNNLNKDILETPENIVPRYRKAWKGE